MKSWKRMLYLGSRFAGIKCLCGHNGHMEVEGGR